jgi:hypothetical protein
LTTAVEPDSGGIVAMHCCSDGQDVGTVFASNVATTEPFALKKPVPTRVSFPPALPVAGAIDEITGADPATGVVVEVADNAWLTRCPVPLLDAEFDALSSVANHPGRTCTATRPTRTRTHTAPSA